MDAIKVVVYVRASDVRMLRERGEDPAAWVRGLIKRALDRVKTS